MLFKTRKTECPTLRFSPVLCPRSSRLKAESLRNGTNVYLYRSHTGYLTETQGSNHGRITERIVLGGGVVRNRSSPLLAVFLASPGLSCAERPQKVGFKSLPTAVKGKNATAQATGGAAPVQQCETDKKQPAEYADAQEVDALKPSEIL